MTPFSAPLDDILFTLTHVAGADRIAGWDGDLVAAILDHFSRFAEEEIAPLNALGDAEGCRLDNGQVILPEAFASAYASFCEQGWPSLAVPEAYDGQGQSATVLGATTEIFIGACHALHMLVGLVPGGIRVLKEFASEEQRARLIAPLASGEALATMALTEPSAGSDLSVIRTRAERSGDAEGGWRISGEKIFISGGGQNLSDRILHFVLARTGTMEEGARGLSLFACPSHLADGSRNAVSVQRIEEKLGIHASPTCQMAFDGAEAELIGEEGGGLRCMFALMDHARLDVSLQGVAHAARAADIARQYAAERRQGRRPGQQGSVVIAEHPDVERMLTIQDSLALGGRAMALSALVELDRGENPLLVDFLTPVCKAFCTDLGSEATDLGIQVLGGYGYLTEYCVEQHWRDVRIARIYEGTNGIHAVTLVGRLLHLKGGAAADAFAAMINAAIAEGEAAGLDVAHLWHAQVAWGQARARIATLDDPQPVAHAFMKLTGLVFFFAVWLRMERMADASKDADRMRRCAAFVRSYFGPEAALWAARCAA